MKDKRSALGLLVAVVVALIVWWTQAGGTSQDTSAGPGSQTTHAAGGQESTGSAGLPVVATVDLPTEARHTLGLIDAGGPFRYDQDGSAFGNFEGILPAHPRGYYTEYTVETPGSDDRGARRIVAGGNDDFYYTDDHYSTFSRITR